jgi:hypothetical protein
LFVILWQVVRAKERLDMEMKEQGQKTFEKDNQTNNQEKPSWRILNVDFRTLNVPFKL